MKFAHFAALLMLGASVPALAQERPANLAGTGVNPYVAQNSAERAINFANTIPAGSALVVPVTDAKAVGVNSGLSAEIVTALQQAADAAKFKAAAGKTLRLHAIGGHPVVLLVGVKADATSADLADAGGTAIQALRSAEYDVAILANALPQGSARSLAFGAALGQYRFDGMKSDRSVPPTNPIHIVSADSATEGQAFNNDGKHVAEGVRFARDLSTTPANALWPERVAELTKQAFAGIPNVRVTILDEAQMRQLNMGALLGVSAGSRRPARLVAVEYRGAGNGAPLALVGKGITFDSGGLSIKPNNGMWEMKGDMSGAASVLGTALGTAKRGAKVNLVAVAALAENMPGGNATRPGDVLRTMNGQTIEVWSSDAEGRLVLADANQWTIKQYKPSGVVNIATLTGAIVSALGSDFAGLFARDENLAASLTAAGAAVSEPLWRMPLIPAYQARISSEIADVKNSTVGQTPGAGLGAQFINYLTPAPTPWAHIDMAAVDRAEAGLPTVPKGPRGFGVRLFDQLLRTYETPAK